MYKKITLPILIFGSLLLTQCATYYDKVVSFHNYLNKGDYSSAQIFLKSNKYLHKKKNEVLYYLELGKTYHLKGDYDSSNICFNKADLIMGENHQLNYLVVSLLVNENSTYYTGEDIERVLIHYYKALNYYYLLKYDDAIVEAKQMNLTLENLNEKRGSALQFRIAF